MRDVERNREDMALKLQDKESIFPEEYQFNLSDFALFLSVMKNPRAHRNVLSIIMDEPDLKLVDVKKLNDWILLAVQVSDIAEFEKKIKG